MPKPQKRRLALVQMQVEAGQVENNYERMAQGLNQAIAGAQKPDVILLPEMWNTGYELSQIGKIADPDSERTKAFFADFCRTHQVNVLAGSVAEMQDDGGIRNTSHLFGRDGRVIASYSKIHLFRLLDEHNHLQAGQSPGRFELDGIPAATMICYDIRFPELARKLALDGAQLLFVPAEWPHPRLHHWRTLLQARAIENQMYVIACNAVGKSADVTFFGHSMVIDPWGEVLAEAGEEETVLTVDIDVSRVEDVRGRIPVFADRRPHLY